MNNEKKKLSKKRKRRVERKIGVDDKKKLLIHKLNLKRKRKMNTLIKLKICKLNIF